MSSWAETDCQANSTAASQSDDGTDAPPMTDLRRLAENLPHLIWTADAEGQCIHANHCLRSYVGDDIAASRHGGWMQAVHADDAADVRTQWQHSVTNGEPFNAEFRLHTIENQEPRWFLSRATACLDEAGNIGAWYGTCTDINDQKLLEQKLQLAKDQSDQNGRLKDEFLSILSHELRTPLSAILGWTQLLEMGALDADETVEAVQIIKQQAKQQSQLIEDLLEVSRIVNGKFHMRRQHVHLAAVVKSSIDALRASADSRKILIEHTPGDASLLVEGDPQRLQQLFSNLLTNAIKFSPAGGVITVEINRRTSGASIQVIDRGRGIPQDQLSAIFDRFKQVNGGTRPHGGLGLGLTIARHIVQNHGGEISAFSEGLDRGSTFTVLLPILAVQPPDPMIPPPPVQRDGTSALNNVRVLVVDDEESARTVIAACLTKFGAHVATASGVQAAAEILAQSEFDVLVSDLSMPEQSGFDMIRHVRGSAKSYQKIPAIALTGFASVDDQTRALEAGYDIHVTKPVDQLELVRQVQELARKTVGA